MSFFKLQPKKDLKRYVILQNLVYFLGREMVRMSQTNKKLEYFSNLHIVTFKKSVKSQSISFAESETMLIRVLEKS